MTDLGIVDERTEQIMDEIKEAVKWSFKVRPMRTLTKAEASRRLDIAFEAWKELVHTGGYDALNAARAVPGLLIGVLDKNPTEGMEGYIQTDLETKLVPHDGGRSLVVPERSLSALAVRGGSIGQNEPLIIMPLDPRSKKS